jgi:hypothetical protein
VRFTTSPADRPTNQLINCSANCRRHLVIAIPNCNPASPQCKLSNTKGNRLRLNLPWAQPFIKSTKMLAMINKITSALLLITFLCVISCKKEVSRTSNNDLALQTEANSQQSLYDLHVTLRGEATPWDNLNFARIQTRKNSRSRY